jgi:hypothetical protein
MKKRRRIMGRTGSRNIRGESRRRKIEKREFFPS